MPDTEVLNPPVSETPESTPPSAPPSGETPPEAPPPSAPEPQPAQPQFTSIRDAAKNYGLDLSQYQDDEAALRHLASQARLAEQLRPMEQYGRRYLTHAQEFEKFLSERQQAPPPAEPKFWEAPEFNPLWLSQVERDPDTGALRPTNGGNAETVAKLERYLNFRHEQTEKFWQNGPFSYLEPYLKHREEQLQRSVQQAIQQHLGVDRQQAEARQFVQENSSWLFQKDAQGQVYIDPASQRPILSPDGQRLYQHLQYAEQIGVPPQHQQDYALRLFQAERAAAGQPAPAGAPTGAPAGDKRADFLKQAAGFQPNAAGTLNRSPDPNGATPPANPNLSLQDQLRANLVAAGITDKDIAGVY